MGLTSKRPDRFGNTSGQTLAKTNQDTSKNAIIAKQAMQMANEWDLTKLKPIRNHRVFLREMDEPTTELEQSLIKNRIKEVKAERLKKGQNELSAIEEENWEQHYYDERQLDSNSFLESIENEVKEDLQKALRKEAQMLKIYQDAKKQHGNNDRSTTKKYDRYLKAKV